MSVKSFCSQASSADDREVPEPFGRQRVVNLHADGRGFVERRHSTPVSSIVMPKRRTAVGPPRDYVDGIWPAGSPTSDAPKALEHARTISLRLAEAVEGRSITEIAADADLARSTIYDLVGGRTWPDLVSLGKLEESLGIDLLPPLPERDGAH